MKRVIAIVLIIILLTASSCKSNGDYALENAETRIESTPADTNADIDKSNEDKITNTDVLNDAEEKPNEQNNESETEVVVEDTQKPEQLPTDEKVTNETVKDESSDDMLIISTSYTPITIREMIEKSTLVVLCEFVRHIDVIRVNGRNYTNTEMNISKILRGEITQRNIIVRTEGGTAGGIMQKNPGIPEFKSGEKYLMFLYNPGINGINNTEGDHYFLSHATDGAMRSVYMDEKECFTAFSSVNSASQSIFADTLDTDSKDAVISVNDFEQILKELNITVPVNPDYTREKELELYKQQYKQGNMSKEEYEKAIKENTQYAVVTDRVPF